MSSKYYAIVTDLGTNKMLRAIKEGKKVNVTNIAVGDGEGEYYKPTAEMTALKNELWRGEVNSCRISEESENLLIIESVIPSDAGGFTVREMAAFDDEGEMIAICNTPDTQKVRVSDGVAHELKLAIEVALSNTDSVQLIIDPNVVTATKKDIEELRIAFEKELEAQKNMGTTGAYRENIKYKVGDYCLYENNLYKCLQDTEGEWDPDCWQQTSPLEEIEQLRGTINSLAMIIGKDEEGNLRQLGEAAFAGISHNFLTEEYAGMVAGADLLKMLKDQVDAQNSASNPKIVSNMNNLFSESCVGLTCFLTGESTADTPQGTAEWKYSIGVLLKRDSEIGTVILWGKDTGRMAICPVNKVLGSWRTL